MTRAAAPMPLYPSEAEIARAVLGAERVKEWPSIAAHDEKKGLPKIDTVHGGRPWPLVEAFYQKLMGLDLASAAMIDCFPVTGRIDGRGRVRMIDTAPDGQEDFRGEKDAAVRARRSNRRAIRARA